MRWFDLKFFRLINGSNGTSLLDGVMLGLSSEWFWSLVFLASIFVCWKKKRLRHFRKYYLLVIFSLVLSDLFCFRVLKANIDRMRPCHELDDVRLMTDSCGSQNGFPSNHASNASACATSVFLLSRKRWTFALFFLMGLVGLSRIYLGVHYPSDVIVGSMVGFFCACICYLVYTKKRFFYQRFK